MKKIDYSIIIPSFNTKKLLDNSLQSIKEHGSKKFNREVVVVDNASYDGSPELVEEKYKGVVLIKNKKNLGFAKACNLGLKKAKGNYIIFLNSDTIVKNKAFDIMMEYAKNNPDVGVISGKLILRDGSIDPDTHRGFPTPWSSLTFFLGLERLFPNSWLFAQYHQGYKNISTIHEIDAGAGALLLIPRKILERVNGWDENYFFYGEDIDLCYRIKQLGLKVMFHPETNVIHYKGASSGLRKESKDIAKPSRENLLKVTKGSINAWKVFYKKFYKNRYPGWVTFLVLAGIETKGALRLLINRIRPI